MYSVHGRVSVDNMSEFDEHEDTMCEKTSARTANARQVPKTHKTNTTNGCSQLLTHRVKRSVSLSWRKSL